jgi:hypothetical protein
MIERLQHIGRRVRERSRAVALAIGLALAMPVLPEVARAQTTSVFPVSSDLATVKSDLLLWATALIGVALAIYAFHRVRSLVR